MILFIELILFFILIRQKGNGSPYVVVYLISFIYLNAVYIDFLLFGITPSLNITISVIPSFDGSTYLLYNFLCLSYFISYFISSFYFHTDNTINNAHPSRSNLILKSGANVILLCLLFYNIYSIVDGFGLSRYDKGQFQTPLVLILRNSVNYFFILSFCVFYKSKNFYRNLFYISNIIYFLFSYEREPLVVLFLCLIYKYKLYHKPLLLVILSPILFFILDIWKVFYVSFLYSDGGGLSSFLYFLDNDTPFSFAGLDPKMSFLLLYDYLDNIGLYNDYQFSYVTGVFNQFHRFLFYSNYETLAEYATNKYTAGNFGTAFSFMLESMLNFSYLGPTIIAITVNYFIKKSLTLSKELGLGFVVVFIFIIMKFMRTELATLLKLQILPLIFSIIIFRLITLKPSNK